MNDRRPSLGEEIASSVSHGVGLVAAAAAVPVLLVDAAQRGGVARVVGASVFAVTMLLLYLASTLYHALPRNSAKRVLQVFDHGAIYLFIAGTYTPFALGVLRGPWGWTLLGLVWSMAIIGVTITAAGRMRSPAVATSFYLAMGWLALIAARPLWLRLPPWGLLWLVAGGLAYTTGVAFFAAKRVPYGHFVWHLFVIVGTACHFIAVLRYA